MSLAPTAAAGCSWTDPVLLGVDVDYCTSDASGRPTMVMVKHKDWGGASVSESEFDLWDARWRFTDVLVWTYWRTPYVGQSATWVGFWCIDAGTDGDCDTFRAGVDSWGLVSENFVGAYVSYTSWNGWWACVIGVHCKSLPLEDAPPYLPYLP